MKPHAFMAAVIGSAFFLSACATGTFLVEPLVTETDVVHAREMLWTHRIEPSRDLDEVEMRFALLPILESMKLPILRTCKDIFASNCNNSLNEMNLLLVQDNSVNAYASAPTATIGINTGLMRAAGSHDEIAVGAGTRSRSPDVRTQPKEGPKRVVFFIAHGRDDDRCRRRHEGRRNVHGPHGRRDRGQHGLWLWKLVGSPIRLKWKSRPISLRLMP